MPEIPAFLADAFAPRCARPARVERIETLSSNIRRIRFALEPAERLRFCPGREVEFRVRRSLRTKACWADGKRGL